MLSNLVGWMRPGRTRKTHAPRQKTGDRPRLRLECLEERVVPAATLFVNQAGTGGAFTSIQAAVTAASDGDTIQVAAGFYQEHVVVNKSVTLLGAEAGVLAYGARTKGESVVDGTLNGTTFTIAANNVVLSGFDIIHGGESSAGGSGISITGNIVGGTITDNIIDDNAIGIYLNGTSILVQGNLIENNNEVGPAEGGIYSDQGSANVTIADNQFQNNQNGAITFAQLPLAIRSNAADPLRNVNLLVTRNAFFDVNLGGFGDLTNGVISYNTVHATADYSNIGVAGGVNGLRILDNVLSGGSRGVRIFDEPLFVAFDEGVPNKGVVISVSNQFSGHSSGVGLLIELGAESDIVDATRNFWNSSTGPTIAGNPSGTGEGIVAPDGNVTFTPFNITPHNAPSHAGAFIGLTSQEHFVQALYMDILNRQGSKAELDGWVAVLNTSGAAAVAAGIENSVEGRDLLVQSFYRNYLGREAQNGEEFGWVNLLQQGATEEQVISGILASDEFYSHAQTLVASGTPDERYVQALYRLLLGRNPSTSEVSSQVGALSMLGRQQLALGFLRSTEFRTDLFEEYYNTLLHRQAESQGLNNWVFSNLDIHNVRIGFEMSPEFFSNG